MANRKSELEYCLKISPHVDERSGEGGHLFELTSVKEFSTFRYDILVKVSMEEKKIKFNILGISTPQFSIPEHGPAGFRKILHNLRGTYEVIVAKVNGPTNKFTIRFSPKRTVGKGRLKNTFVQIETTHKV